MVKEKIFLAPTENSKIYTETYAKLGGYDDVEWLDNCMENMTGRLTSANDKGVHIVAGFLNKETALGSISPNPKAHIIAVKGDIDPDFVNTMERIVCVMKNGKTYINKIDQ